MSGWREIFLLGAAGVLSRLGKPKGNPDYKPRNSTTRFSEKEDLPLGDAL
jgi:hypothetical protein